MSVISLSFFHDSGHFGGHIVYKLCAGCGDWRWSVLLCSFCVSKICCLAVYMAFVALKNLPDCDDHQNGHLRVT